MIVKTVVTGALNENCYIAMHQGECAVIDPGADGDRIFEEMNRYGVIPKGVLLTHGHFDHIGAVSRFQQENVPVYVSEQDAEMLYTEKHMGEAMGLVLPKVHPDLLVHDGDKIVIAGIEFQAMATPGHTVGGMCYITKDCIFTGDTLFCGSVGRSDFPGGNFGELMRSVKKLAAINGNYVLYPGHEESSDLDHERKYNPYLSEQGYGL